MIRLARYGAAIILNNITNFKISIKQCWFTEPALEFCRRIGKSAGTGLDNFNAGSVKPAIYNIF